MPENMAERIVSIEKDVDNIKERLDKVEDKQESFNLLYAFFFAVVIDAMSFLRIVPHFPETFLYCSSEREEKGTCHNTD